jgi:hypothetical protein
VFVVVVAVVVLLTVGVTVIVVGEVMVRVVGTAIVVVTVFVIHWVLVLVTVSVAGVLQPVKNIAISKLTETADVIIGLYLFKMKYSFAGDIRICDREFNEEEIMNITLLI